jgi:hypothetical protein
MVKSERRNFTSKLEEQRMFSTLSGMLDQLVRSDPVDRIRRNHGLEHATLHVLARRLPRVPLAGHSDSGGFWIMEQASLDDPQANLDDPHVRLRAVQEAVDEALRRLRAGESELAVHPNCGTNFVTSGVLAGVAASLAMFGAGSKTRDKLERLPLAISLATLTLVSTQPLGLRIQERYTTSGAPGDLQVVSITARQRGRFTAYRVVTEG